MTVEITCPEIQARGDQLCVRMPGGTRLCVNLPGVQGPPLELAQQLMAQATAAMAPLAPFFDVVGALVALKDLVEALVSDPFDIADAAQDLLEKLAAVAALVPPMSIVAMVFDLIDLILAYLAGVADLLDALAAQEARIQNAIAVAENENLDVLRQAAECASEQLAAYLANIRASSAPLDSLVELINLFIGMIPGVPEIPTPGELSDDIEEAADQIRALVSVLVAIRDAIPI